MPAPADGSRNGTAAPAREIRS